MMFESFRPFALTRGLLLQAVAVLLALQGLVFELRLPL